MSPAVESPQSKGDKCLGDSSSASNCIETADQKMQSQSSLVGERANSSSGDSPKAVGRSLPPNPLLYHQPTANYDLSSSHSPRRNLSISNTTTSTTSGKKESRISSKQSLKRSSDSDNIVTTSMTRNSSSSSDWQDANHGTTSSGSGGDDYDRGAFMELEKAIEDEASKTMPSNENIDHSTGEAVSAEGDAHPPKKKARHHPPPHDPRSPTSWTYAAGTKSQSPKDDGSSLQVPGDDGSDRIVAGDTTGGVPIKPATVVASRLFTPSTASTGTDHSISSSEALGSKQKLSSKTTAQNQHHDLLPPHKEPRYHTIRDTLYRFNGNERPKKGKKYSHHSNNRSKNRRRGNEKKSSKTNDKTDPSSAEEVVKNTITSNGSMMKHRHHHHHHRGSCSSGSNSSTSAPKQKTKRIGDKSRSTSNSDITTNANQESVKSKSSDLTSPSFSILQEANAGGSSSGSGTEGTEDGYAGSISSNENGSGNQQLGSSSPSPSETSSEEYEQQEGRHKVRRNRRSSNSKQKSSGEDQEVSSEIADFGSSGSSETMDEEDEENRRRREDSLKSSYSSSSSSSPSLSSSNFSESDGLELAYLSAKRDADAEHERKLKLITRKKKSKQSALHRSMTKSLSSPIKRSKRMSGRSFKDGRPPILAMGCDVMAHILTFLQPPDILNVLTMPLSKGWRRNFTSQPELWRVLCLVEPFKATMDDDPISSSRNDDEDGGSSSDDTYCRLNKTEKNTDKSLDKYRLLYTSFVRCMKYVAQIREDAINGRPPAYIDYGISGAFSNAPGMQYIANITKGSNNRSSTPPPPTALGSNRNLQLFLARANEVINSSNNDGTNDLQGEAKTDDTPTGLTIFPSLSTAARVGTGHKKHERNTKAKTGGPKFGRSMITSRLFRPVEGGDNSNLNLPWSCAIYSIVNWMVAFSDVEGIQVLCLKVLPVLLENEQHRMTAQHAGLAEVVLRAMVIFSKSAQLHIAAFHTIVLLARPHGGKEGMMFRASMTADGIFRGIYQGHGKSGIAVMLDSMRRFQDNSTLLAMSCWALVNIALVSDQKAVLVKLGGIQAITNAMYRHPLSAELQFRALFALINLVIPSVQKLDGNNNGDNNDNGGNNRGSVGEASQPSESEQLGELNDTSEKEIIDELVGDIASLVVHVMKNFCSSEAILNRACLVLHNLSLTDEYHATLLWTPQCYQMLQWCVANFRSDQVLQQSATGTLHRLESTLAANDEMRARFSRSLETQKENLTLKQAQRGFP